jgi:hypothetical protein
MQVGGLTAKVEQELLNQVNEMFFASVRVFVEGLEDIAYLNSYLTLSGKLDEFRSLGCHIVQTQGKSHLIEALAISKALNLPYFTVVDADGDETNPDKRLLHEKDNTAILKLHDIATPNPFPTGTFWKSDMTLWESEIGNIVKDEIGDLNWQRLSQQVRTKYGIYTGGMQKNSLFIGYLMAEAWEENLKSTTVIKLCDQILNYAKSLALAPSTPNSQPEEVPESTSSSTTQLSLLDIAAPPGE